MSLQQARRLPVVQKYSGHETFPFRYPWMNKIADGVSQKKAPISFRDHDRAMVEFGVGKNMVQSMQHWGKALGVLEPEGDRLTAFGNLIFPSKKGLDPYLEDPNTIWLLHWKLARNDSQATTWWWVFNRFDGGWFTRKQLFEQFNAALTFQDKSIARKTLEKDIQVFIQSYVGGLKPGVVKEDTLDCPLTELMLIRSVKTSDGRFQFVHGEQQSLSHAIFTYALVEYLESRVGESLTGTVSFEELWNGENSPGRVFRLSERSLLRRLAKVTKTERGLRFDETAGLKQLTVSGALPDKEELLVKQFSQS